MVTALSELAVEVSVEEGALVCCVGLTSLAFAAEPVLVGIEALPPVEVAEPEGDVGPEPPEVLPAGLVSVAEFDVPLVGALA